MNTCTECAEPFAVDANPRRVTCSHGCRQRRSRRRREERLTALITDVECAALTRSEILERLAMLAKS